MKRRFFLKLIGAVVLAPSLPIPAKSGDGWFIYRGYKFRKDIRMMPIGEVVQLYTEVEICGERYCNAILIDPEEYKYRDMYCDNMIHGIERLKHRLAS